MKFLFFILVCVFKVLKVLNGLKTNTKTKTKTHTNTKSLSLFRLKDPSSFSLKPSEESLLQKQFQSGLVKPPVDIDLDLGPGPIFWNGWVKFLKYETNSTQKITAPKSFHRNDQFYKQMKNNPELNTNIKEANTYKYIKDEYFFFSYLMSDFFNILSSKEKDYERTVELINIESIKNVKESLDYEGGIKDFGNFKEGYCFKLKTDSDTGKFNYIICTESSEEETVLMSCLKKIKLKKQRESGVIFEGPPNPVEQTISDFAKEKDTPTNQFDEMKSNARGNVRTLGPLDGYWVTIQDWSQCNLKCGGGNSTMQRVCVAARPGGRECVGPDTISKQCNLNPCPAVIQKEKIIVKNYNIPIVKVMPFMRRPQKYSKCIVKESDLLYTKSLLSTQIQDDVDKVPLPVRVVMNNRTITLFGDEDYNSVIVSFDLKRTVFHISKNNKKCFILVDTEIKNKEAELCPFGFTEDETILQQWELDFNMFKQKCYHDLPIADLFKKRLEKKLNDKIKDVEREVEFDRESLLQNKLRMREESDIDMNIKKTNELAYSLIKRELNIQELIKKEEAERERREQDEIQNQINSEERKAEVIMNTIKQKEIEDQFNIKAQLKQKELDGIKKEVVKEVVDKRNELKDYVKVMRRRAERNKMMLRSKLIGVRMGLATKMKDAYKEGDLNICDKGMATRVDKLAYCQAQFSDNFDKLIECKGPEFCHVCCEHEYGSAMLEKRQACNDEVCQKQRPSNTNNDNLHDILEPYSSQDNKITENIN